MVYCSFANLRRKSTTGDLFTFKLGHFNSPLRTCIQNKCHTYVTLVANVKDSKLKTTSLTPTFSSQLGSS